ncbi:MAG: hypothetical protein JSU86_06265 [Phycisphaerales bacterium]|nr:MAG: hypothetical protein JSU86_06265 [Phycisphaerales bacterium]
MFMRPRSVGFFRSFPVIVTLALFVIPAFADGQPPRKKRVKKEPPKVQKPRAAPSDKSRPRRLRPRKAYVPTRREYGHVRVARRSRHGDQRLNIRPVILRSARVTPVVLDRFEDRRRDQLHLVIRHFKEGHRARALEVWGGFVDGLADYREHIDLDEVMLFVARESCFHEDDRALFHALKLEFLQDSRERLERYIDRLHEQRTDCTGRISFCSPETFRDLDAELTRARADHKILDLEIRVVSDEFEARMQSLQDYEHRFAAAFDGMYREVEVRIQLSP